MAVFEYKALNAKAEEVRGIIDADTPADARGKLRRQGIFPTEVKESAEKVDLRSDVPVSRILRRVKPADVAIFTRQMATLLNAGLPLVTALAALIDQLEKSPLKRVIIKVRDQVNAGLSLGAALAPFPRVFSPLYVNMIQAGETAGALDVVLERLADLTEKNVKMRNKIRAIMVYPVVVAAIGAGVVIFLLVKVVPTIISIFSETQQTLPAPTLILLKASSLFRDFWWGMALALLGLYLLFNVWRRSARGAYLFDALKLKLPLFGILVRKVAVVRFSRTLATLLASGTPLLKSLDIVKNIVGNLPLGAAIEKARESVKAGKPLAEPFGKAKIFPPIVVHMIAVGETSGSLETMLYKVASSYEDEVETTITALTSILEPIMILIMAFAVGFVVIAILLPIFQMSQIIY
ncbi:MAG: type II secretion system inner membrane protein GspF [Candidatus Aureabacteria bacterium]|nr:type II secretion system inner membrane protein GspF [Candidatus Auribacterota bacterium]